MHNPLPTIINSIRNGSKHDFIYLVTTSCVGIMYYSVYSHNRSAVGTNAQSSCETLKTSEACAAPVGSRSQELVEATQHQEPLEPFPFLVEEPGLRQGTPGSVLACSLPREQLDSLAWFLVFN